MAHRWVAAAGSGSVALTPQSAVWHHTSCGRDSTAVPGAPPPAQAPCCQAPRGRSLPPPPHLPRSGQNSCQTSSLSSLTPPCARSRSTWACACLAGGCDGCTGRAGPGAGARGAGATMRSAWAPGLVNACTQHSHPSGCWHLACRYDIASLDDIDQREDKEGLMESKRCVGPCRLEGPRRGRVGAWPSGGACTSVWGACVFAHTCTLCWRRHTCVCSQG